MYRVNPRMHSINMMDGNGFLTWLQKLGRISEDILLGYVDEKTVTLENLKIPEPAEISSIARSLSPSPSVGVSLPDISSKKNRSQSAQSRNIFSAPSNEIVSTERTVSRGVGGEDSVVSVRSSYTAPKTAASILSSSLADEEEFDPYIPYMIQSFGARMKSRQRSPGRVDSISDNLSSYRRSPSPKFHDTGNESVISAVTDISMFSPIHSKNTEKSAPMVVSLLGNNPWSEIGASSATSKRGRRSRAGTGENVS